MYLTLRDPATRGTSRRPSVRAVSRTVVLLGIVSMITDVSTESVNAVLPIYLTTVLGLTGLAYGFVDALYQGVSALVRVLGGWASDRLDRPKWVAGSGYAGAAVARAFLPFVSGLGPVVAIVTADRLGKGLRTAPRDSLIAAVSPPEGQARAFGVHRALDTLGALIGPVLAFSLLWALPGAFHTVFVVSSAFGLVAVAVLVLLVPDVRPRRRQHRAAPAAAPTRAPTPSATPRQTPARAALPRPSPRLLVDRRLARVVVVAALLGLTTVSDAFLYLQLADAGGLASRYFPLLLVGTNLAYLVLAVPLGTLADRIGRGRVFVAGHVALLGAYLAAGGPVAGAAATIASLLLLGVYYAATDGVLAAMAGQAVAPEVRGSAIATAQTATAAARFVSSIVFGSLWSWIGRDHALWVFTAALLLVIVPAWALLRAPDRSAAVPA